MVKRLSFIEVTSTFLISVLRKTDCGEARMSQMQRCTVLGCGMPASSSLDLFPLCTIHFISACRDRLREYEGKVGEKELDLAVVDRHLLEVGDRAATLVISDRTLNDGLKSQLVDIVFGCATLTQRASRRRQARA